MIDMTWESGLGLQTDKNCVSCKQGVIMMAFGDRLKLARKKAGMTMRELAEQTDPQRRCLSLSAM